MKNDCSNCQFMKFTNTEVSPGETLVVQNYKCLNPESVGFNTVKNVITNSGRTLDSRISQTCDDHKK